MILARHTPPIITNQLALAVLAVLLGHLVFMALPMHRSAGMDPAAPAALVVVTDGPAHADSRAGAVWGWRAGATDGSMPDCAIEPARSPRPDAPPLGQRLAMGAVLLPTPGLRLVALALRPDPPWSGEPQAVLQVFRC